MHNFFKFNFTSLVHPKKKKKKKPNLHDLQVKRDSHLFPIAMTKE